MQHFLGAVTQFAATLLTVAVVLGYGGPIIYELDVLGHFRLHFLLILILLFVLAAALRRWSALWRALLGVFVAMAGLSPLWETPGTEKEGFALSVMTANVHHENPRTEEMVTALRGADADVLVTNETTKAALSGADPLSEIYPYRVALTTRGRILRTVIWSKFPMRDGTLLLEDRIEPNGAIAIVQLPDGREVSILGLHLAHAIPGNQALQVAALGDITATLPRPLIVMGDFNASPWSYAVRQAEELTGTERVPGYRVTWQGAYPSPAGPVPSVLGHAIDHILLSPGLRTEAVAVVDIPGADHDAVRAIVRLPDS